MTPEQEKRPVSQPQVFPPQQQKPKLPHRNLAIAVAIICLLVGSSTVVYAAFVLSGGVSLLVTPTGSGISGIVLTDTTAGAPVALSCSPSYPAATVSCTASGAAPTHAYRLDVTTTNTGTVPVPSVYASGLAVIVYHQLTFVTASTTYSTTATATSTIASTVSSTTNLTVSGTWLFSYTFTVPADAIDGGTITLTTTVNG